MNFFEELTERALNDSYLKLLIYKADTIYGQTTFGNSEIGNFTSKEYYDILRFADILSRSKKTEARNTALKIISLLYELDDYKHDNHFKNFAESVLTKLGNFPSISIIDSDGQDNNDEEIKIDKILKSTMQQAPNSDYIFTDAQYDLFEKMKDSNHYSFSGSTSFGKSFIFEAFMNYIIDERNASDNIAILVPTRALINQVCLKLKSEIENEKYKIISHPKVPLLYRKEDNRFIFVFTPERLISYFADSNNPSINYLFVDEAHKLLSSKDQRTPLLYHALMQAKRKSVKLYFASPNVPNTEVFLQLFGNSIEESTSITESPVTQNRFFIDCIKEKAVMFSEYGQEIPLNGINYANSEIENLTEVVNKLGADKQNIIYCNRIEDTINLAREFSANLKSHPSKKMQELINLIKETVHDQYFLIDCLKKRVAFHFGKIPQRIRERIEALFRSGEIRFLFCTSTLLEGVNLPAKNIFILSKKIGKSNMDEVSFWNLAGRAGRLTKDLSGNIFCVRIFDKEGYWKKPEEIDILKNKKITKVESPLMKKYDGNLYKNISNSLSGKPFTNKNLSVDKIKYINIYGNILLYHDIVKSDSILRNRFLEKNKDAKIVLEKVTSNIKVPDYIIAQSANIKVHIQNKIHSSLSVDELPEKTDYNSCLKMLNIIYDYYEWDIEESKGSNPLVKNRSQLNYYAILINTWVNSKPLKYIISNTIKYFDENNKMLLIRANELEIFNKKSSTHINILINNLISDIENAIRFKIKSYVNNYILLLEERGVKVKANWSDYLEYGTIDKFVIEIQNIGFPRHLATFLKDNYPYCFIFDGGEIIEFASYKLKSEIDKKRFKNEFNELSELLEWT
ncbi:DEAD/DEAH box helicase [Oceanobacillus sp. J11TS1]|uniref:DEAD/DEAH box helicase n=1 Tax=Oceanobacillus sp. J11TS1 TaxID=2807191 RepID=UPI001B032AE9|nr:DEAD/DEAH box helicase [Oceanobacillus sp. J11TS1]GIO23468.1 DEAD/DEAH box helicase [Oceanobacillus sp. J11TS1]